MTRMSYLAKLLLAITLLCTTIVVTRNFEEDATTYIHALLKTNNISSLKPPNPVSMEYNKRILCLYQGGGLGNNMFQYASMYAIAKSKGMRFVVPVDLDLLKIFKLNVTDIDHIGYLCDPKRVYTRPEKQCCAFDNKLIDFDNTFVIRLIWNLASYYYFVKFSSDIRRQYTFVQRIQVKS